MTPLDHLDDGALEDTIKDSIRQRSKLTAQSLGLLVEVERRELHLRRAFNSMFTYCTEGLGMSEGSARKHMYVARKARRFPELLEAIAAGQLHLSGACAIASRLNEKSASALIWHASGKTRRKIEEMLAERYPQPEVAPSLRRLPARRATPAQTPCGDPSAPSPAGPPLQLTSPPPTYAEPLSAQRFKLTITIDRPTRDALERLVGLRRHAVPSGDLATIVSAAITHELEREQKRRFGTGRRSPSAHAENATRPIPASVRRTVYDRDNGRCTYVCPATRRRCDSQELLELHHIDPWARHRIHDADRITLRCRAHNQHQARLDFGAAHIQAHIDRKAALNHRRSSRPQDPSRAPAK